MLTHGLNSPSGQFICWCQRMKEDQESPKQEQLLGDFVKFSSLPGPEAAVSFAWLPGLRAEPESSCAAPVFGAEPLPAPSPYDI